MFNIPHISVTSLLPIKNSAVHPPQLLNTHWASGNLGHWVTSHGLMRQETGGWSGGHSDATVYRYMCL